MANKEKVKSIIKDLMEQLYEAKGFNNLHCNPLERNIFEAEMKDLWEDIEAHVTLYTDEREEYEEKIEALEDERNSLQERILQLDEENTELATQNYDLACEKKKLWDKLQEISKVVNDTWS